MPLYWNILSFKDPIKKKRKAYSLAFWEGLWKTGGRMSSAAIVHYSKAYYGTLFNTLKKKIFELQQI